MERSAWFCLALAACQPQIIGTIGEQCDDHVLFGRPNAQTGLSSEQCAPRCSCSGKQWQPPEYGAADVAKLREWKLTRAFDPLVSDPYADPVPDEPGPDSVCAVVVESAAAHTYHLQSFASAAAAQRAGAIPTHFGVCGLCSPLVDLAAYMHRNDLTAPVRACGLANYGGTAEAHIACLQTLGFDFPCAQIWYFNTVHTGAVCSRECFAELDKPYHTPDGALNACLQCDEDKSGPVFKAIAGRTRRNTGLANAMCRPCSEVRALAHDYR